MDYTINLNSDDVEETEHEEYKSVIIITPYIGTVNNGNILLNSLDRDEIEFVGQDIFGKLNIEKTHTSYIDCINTIKKKLHDILHSISKESD